MVLLASRLSWSGWTVRTGILRIAPTKKGGGRVEKCRLSKYSMYSVMLASNGVYMYRRLLGFERQDTCEAVDPNSDAVRSPVSIPKSNPAAGAELRTRPRPGIIALFSNGIHRYPLPT